MNGIHRQHSILIIDDRENLSRVLVPQLTQAGYEVHVVNSIVAALEHLKHPPSPTFILADRMLDEPIEVRNLARLCETAPASKVLVYTGQALTEDERYAIRSQGAYRLLDKDFVNQLVKNIDSLTQELDELLALTTELERATSERSRIMAVLAGTDATVSVVDNQFHRWFHSGIELLGSGACRNQCWSASGDKGTASATCWGCAVADVFREGKAVDRLFLNQFVDGSLGWVAVHSTPIHAKDGRTIIAAREAVTRVSETTLAGLGRDKRLYHIAESLVRTGFGRARIYRAESARGIRLVAAASRTDESGSYRSAYFESIQNIVLNADDCPYMRRAVEDGHALLVDDWAGLDSPYKHILGLEPPYFDIPVWRETGGQLEGWIAADFVGMGAMPRKRAIQRLAKESSLEWLEDGYAREARLAFETTASKPGHREKLEIAQRARLGIVGAGSVDQAKGEIRSAFEKLLPRCRVSVRIRKGDSLREFDGLSWGTPLPDSPEGSPSVISLSNPRSLAASVIKSHKGVWLVDYDDYARRAAQQGDPLGYPPQGTKSTVQIPLTFENTAFGTLSVNSPERIDWTAEGYEEPLRILAETTALVLRDLALYEEREKATADRAAIVAYSVSSSADALWRHWAQQRLAEASAILASAQLEIDKQPVIAAETVDGFLMRLSSVITRIHTARPESEPSQSASVGATFKRLQDIYANKQPTPSFICVEDATLAIPEFIFRNILEVLVDNSLKAILRERKGGMVKVEASSDGNSFRIDVIDDGPGISPDKRGQILREPVKSESGRGIGLLYSRGAALQYNGDLELLPSRTGAHFVLRLPLR